MVATARQNRRKTHDRGGQNSRHGSSRRVGGAPPKTKARSQGIKEKLTSMFPAIGELLTGGISMEFDSLRDFYLKELQDLYSAENQLLKALPKMAEAAISKELRSAFQSHLKETEGHVARLDKVFEALGKRPTGTKCKAMAGLIAEGNEWMHEKATPGVMDVGLIAAAQRVEHYEIAGYGCVRTYAELLGEQKAAALLQETLDEESSADKKLTHLSKKINIRAESDGESAAKTATKRPKARRTTKQAIANGRRKGRQ